jgi:hypothetical protein
MLVERTEDQEALSFEPLRLGAAADDRSWNFGMSRFGGPRTDEPAA